MSRQVWNQHAYAIVHVNDDLSIPVSAESNWPTHNNFRSGDLQPQPSWKSSDPVPVAEICMTECPQDRISLMIRVGNSGAVDFRLGVPVSVYTDSSSPTLLATVWTTQTVAPGGTSEILTVELSPDDVVDGELWVAVDDDSGSEVVLEECDEDNNVLLFTEVWCP
jgi:hypothetical protein